ncbi:MAG: CHASE2 domain-containing protein [Gemmatimonadetes bacterium]|nr:CHASE2 domain-containing protein [Gemmatimonadota bacterium]
MAAEKSKSEPRLQFYLGPLVGLLVFLFSLTEFYERAELVSYDWRFNLRNSLFGLPPMDPRLGTIEIDDQSIEMEGRWQDWTRDKYSEVIRQLSNYDARLVGFDIYYIEPSTKLISEDRLLGLEQINPDAVHALLAQSDYDEMFRQAITASDNVYLALYLGRAADDLSLEEIRAKTTPLSPDEKVALEDIRSRSPRLMVDAETSTLTRAFYFEPPLKMLRDAARGFAYAQTETDVDGARRRYPLVYQYEDVLFPSIALAMVCDHLQIPLETVEVWPGDQIKLPGARFADGTVEDIEIPIDARGNMHVNWAGKWEETFIRYPHIALRRAFQRDQQQKLLDEIKKLIVDPAIRSNPRKLPETLAAAGFTDQKNNKRVVNTVSQALFIERTIKKDPQLTAEKFWAGKVANPAQEQLDLFNSIKRTNHVADLLAENPDIDIAELLTALPDEPPESIRQSHYFVRSQMTDRRLASEARPLLFYPYKIYQGRLLTPDDVKDKILFYGQTSTGSTDLSVTPFQGNYPMVGIYSNVFNTILNGNFITRIPAWLDGLLIILLGALLSLTVPRLKVLQGALIVAAIVLLYAVLALFAFTHLGTWLEMVGPLAILVVGYLVLTIYGYIIKEKEKDFVQGAFGHYLSPAVVSQIMDNPDMVNQLGGEERVMTAFFSDIESFSTISECLTPGELVEFINQYLTEMCDIIEQYGGTIDKFEGDAIVAFFGAPLYYEDHGLRAVMACIDQQHKLIELRQRWSQEGAIPPPLDDLRQRWAAQGRSFCHVRMGVATGPMIVGNMGSKSRTDYTMMGDTVNLAARFESGQKIYKIGIMINDLIYEAVKDQIEGRKLDEIQVVGKEEPVVAYEVLGRKGALSPEKQQVLELYNRGLELFNEFKFAEAQQIFEQAMEIDPEDGPSALYADRCEDFAENPPDDLVFRAESK